MFVGMQSPSKSESAVNLLNYAGNPVSSPSDEPIMPGGVMGEMDALQVKVNELHQLLKTLESRLDPVLSCGGLDPEPDKLECPSKCSASGRIRGMRLQVGSAGTRVQEILERLAI